MIMDTHRFRQAAEEYIDNSSLANATGELAQIAHEKAQHVREAWQDETLAKAWERCARILERAEASIMKDAF